METGVSADPYNAFSEKAIRQGFIRKVYAILSVQLLITFIPMLCVSYSHEAKLFAYRNWWLFLVAIIANIVIVLPMICIRSLRTKVPLNYILLGLFTLSESIMFVFVGGALDVEVVTIAIAITAFIVIGLTIFALQTKIDFTMCNGLIFCLVMALCLASFALLFYQGENKPLINIVYCGIGALVFSFAIVIDTQMIVGGSRSMEVSPEEYIFASLMIYIDIMRLFLYILQIVAELKK